MYLLINDKPTQFRPGDRITYNHEHCLIDAGRDLNAPDALPDNRLKWRKDAIGTGMGIGNKVCIPLLKGLPRERVRCLLVQLFRIFTGLELTLVRSKDSDDFFNVVGPEGSE